MPSDEDIVYSLQECRAAKAQLDSRPSWNIQRFDGDTVSWIPIFAEESVKECEEFSHSIPNYILPNGNTLDRMSDDIVKLTIHSLMRDVPELKK